MGRTSLIGDRLIGAYGPHVAYSPSHACTSLELCSVLFLVLFVMLILILTADSCYHFMRSEALSLNSLPLSPAG